MSQDHQPQPLTNLAIREHLASLAKPPGSLGRLEDLACELCRIQQTLRPVSSPRKLVVFGGDHAVISEGVTAWPGEITQIMLETIAQGKAASSALAMATTTSLEVFDVGSFRGGVLPNRGSSAVRRDFWMLPGARNLARQPAMTVDELEQGLTAGRKIAREVAAQGFRVVAGGEMGIGNTTSAACITSLICDESGALVVGRGAGADDETLRRKTQVVTQAVERARQHGTGQLRKQLAEVAGVELAALAGFFAESTQLGLVVILDGFIATAAALMAEVLWPESRRNWIAAHCSTEPGHAIALEFLQLDPFLNWQMRLGEGTGALLLMPMLDAACAILSEMTTIAQLQTELVQTRL